jgi:hypothetical protein
MRTILLWLILLAWLGAGLARAVDLPPPGTVPPGTIPPVVYCLWLPVVLR